MSGFRRRRPIWQANDYEGARVTKGMTMKGFFAISILVTVTVGCTWKNAGTFQTSQNMKLVATNDLQARSSYQVLVNKQGGKYIAYVGHHSLTDPGEGMAPTGTPPLPRRNILTGQDEENGTSIVDVTDPAHPNYLAHLPVSAHQGGGAQLVRVCGNLPSQAAAGKFYLLRNYHNAAQEIWDVTDPSHPQGVHTVKPGVATTAADRGNHLIGHQSGAANRMASTHNN